MASTFFGLDIGKTGLYAYQAALNTTAHNVSNAEVDGYSRQAANMAAHDALKVAGTYGMQGTGINVSGVKQIRNEYYDVKYWDNRKMNGMYTTKSYYMQQTQNYFNEVKLEGFTTCFDNFFDSLQELSKNPSSETVRTATLNYAKSFTEYMNSLSTDITSIQEEANFEIKSTVDRINSLGEQISGVTKQINALEMTGMRANDLRDSRARLVDELSELASTKVEEKTLSPGEVGVTQYTVKIDGKILVDTYDFNKLVYTPRKEKINMDDADGLYEISWSNGQGFNMNSSSLGGTLQALIQIRDGNNENNFKGIATASAGDSEIVLTQPSITDINKLNIPDEGLITVKGRDYVYTGFSVTCNEEGEYEYTFQLKEGDELGLDIDESEVQIGNSINYKGIPYYTSQLNEFVRVFSKAFNEVHKKGVNLDGEFGMDLFNGVDKTTGENFTFNVFQEEIDAEEGYEFDNLTHTYYRLTAANFTITKAIVDDPKLVVCSDPDNEEEGGIHDGVENQKVIEQLMALKTDKLMFRQGTPASFLQKIIADIGVDTEKAVNFAQAQDDILYAVDNQRLSVMGVDIDEEAMSLIKYQNAYNLSCKVISVMDEIYDKLINYTGV